MRAARRFLISGRVQGVGFRFYAEAVAGREGVHGWVRNLLDGRVEVAADERQRHVGDRDGPRGARVDRVDVEDDVPTGRETGFSIR